MRGTATSSSQWHISGKLPKHINIRTDQNFRMDKIVWSELKMLINQPLGNPVDIPSIFERIDKTAPHQFGGLLTLVNVV